MVCTTPYATATLAAPAIPTKNGDRRSSGRPGRPNGSPSSAGRGSGSAGPAGSAFSRPAAVFRPSASGRGSVRSAGAAPTVLVV